MNVARSILYLALVFLLCGNTDSYAQKSDNVKDMLSSGEIAAINASTKNSSFLFYGLADSCSSVGDSVDAGKYLMQVDPYCLMFKNIAPDSINGFLLNNFKLTNEAREKYVAIYRDACNTKKTMAYATFKSMAEEDKMLRSKLDQCTESKSYNIMRRAMQYLDSVHFDYLYQYTEKNGWPGLANGSLYAGILAVHDQANYFRYLDMVSKAVMHGDLPIDFLEEMYYFKARAVNTAHCDQIRRHSPFIRFDISSVIRDNKAMPADMPDIIEAVKKHCPVMLNVIVEAPNRIVYYNWLNGLDSISSSTNNECALGKINMKLADHMCKTNEDVLYGMRLGLWGVSFEPTENTDMAVKLYVSYEGNDTDTTQPYAFSQILTEKKFTTHAIHFDVDRSTIQPESYDFLQQLADWLRSNPTVKLEIDGHTDNDGNPESNMKLSHARADEVKKQLVALGADGNRLSTKGYGASKPIQPNDTPEGKANNRRVEFIKR
jgi:outer membrane protein OmpA-like peptidoglycan-associated protein